MYYELSDKELKIIKKVKDITNIDYELRNNSIPVDSLVHALEDMLYEVECLNKKIEDMENDIESNYRPLTYKELYGD